MGTVLDLNPKLAKLKADRERKERDGHSQRLAGCPAVALFTGDADTFGAGFMTSFVLDPEAD